MGKDIKYYIVDISDCEQFVIDDFMGLTKIPVMTGQYGKDFDLIEDQISGDLCNKLRHVNKSSNDFAEQVELYYGEDGLACMNRMPMGFNIDGLPPKSKLINI